MSENYKHIIDILNQLFEADFSVYDEKFMMKIIETRYAETNKTGNDYVLFLISNPSEQLTIKRLCNNVYTEFFRNQFTFCCLSQVVLPLLFQSLKKLHEGEIRLWSAACASGQETYSLAILCEQYRNRSEKNVNYRIFASDFNTDELQKAEKGEYCSQSLDNVTLKQLQNYFSKNGGQYVIMDHLKSYINFSYFNLFDDERLCPTDSIFGNFDIIFCSNLLFYYKPFYQKKIIDKVTSCLAPGGFLVTGEAEREIISKNGFAELITHSCIFNIK